MLEGQQKITPYKAIKIGLINATIWENIGKDNKPFYSVKFSKSYKDASGGWKSSESFYPDDLAELAVLCNEIVKQLRIK
jgi:hypothetical protein